MASMIVTATVATEICVRMASGLVHFTSSTIWRASHSLIMTTAKNYRAPSSGFPKVVLDEQ
ncbi:hypothetical protein MFRU_011g02480 [Monilinia fructicola]|nr:hypothetical protein MFRU_011g02480 [Monilinia fructicola]